MDHSRSRHYVNVVIAGKSGAAVADDGRAVRHCSEGIASGWASSDQSVAPDVVMACWRRADAGDARCRLDHASIFPI
jgi:phosphoketolase